jgi:hypothetical protein
MTTLHASPLLRRILTVDATVSGGFGLLMLLLAGQLVAPLGLPAALSRTLGALLLLFGLAVLALARRPAPPRAGVIAVVATNLAWVVASVALLLAGWIELTRLGSAFVLAQALAVAAFAALQVLGLERSTPATAAYATR